MDSKYLVLKDAGLTEGEIKVYLSLLKIGVTTTGKIIKESGVAKSFVYKILDNLIKKGLVSYITKDKTNHYQASNPEKIIEYIEIKKQELENSKKIIKDFMPELKAIQSDNKKSKVQIYEGFKGVQVAFERHLEVLKEGEEFTSLGIFPEQKEHYHAYWKRYHLERIKRKIKCRMIFNKGTKKEILENRNSYKDCDSRYMPTDIQTPAWIMFYSNTTAIFLQDEDLVVEIVNEKIAKTFKAYFEDYWKNTKKFNK